MQEVVVGQVWSALDQNRIRVEVEIMQIERDKRGLTARCEITSNRKKIPFLVSALAKGMRGARLVRRADGSLPCKPKQPHVPKDLENSATASDFRRVERPKGLSPASERAEEAWKMRFEQGMSVKDVAAALGVKPSRVSSWCAQVRDKREDERALGRTGS